MTAPESDVRLRTAVPEDNAAVAAIIRKVMTEFGCTGPGYAIHDAEVDRMAASYPAPLHRYWVVERDGRVLGGGGIAPLSGGDGKTCELRKMYFLEAVRGLGAGARLMEEALKFAREAGYTKVYLETMRHMTAARKLYEKYGFLKESKPSGGTGHHSCDTWYARTL
jgi:putative acetyltransferase